MRQKGTQNQLNKVATVNSVLLTTYKLNGWLYDGQTLGHHFNMSEFGGVSKTGLCNMQVDNPL